MTTITLTLDGGRVHDIASFYDEINRVFMAGEDWQLGASLDALDDMLHGGYGALLGVDHATVVWTGFEHSRLALGVDATRAHLLAKLAQPRGYDVARIKRELAALESGAGPSYFDLVCAVIAAHPKITLLPG